MSDNNVVSIGTKEPFVDAKAEQVKWLREMADALEAVDSPIETAFALFMRTTGDDLLQVKCEGFSDNATAQCYFLTYMRNHGFK
jgi:hypothetical protein